MSMNSSRILLWIRDALVYIIHLRIVRLMVAIFVVIATLAWVFQVGRFNPDANKSDAVLMDEQNKKCLALEMNDNAETDAQRTYAAFANMNVAKATGQSNCRVYEQCLTTTAPGQTFQPCTWVRQQTLAGLLASFTEQGELSASVVLRSKILENRDGYIAAHPELPELACVQGLNRSKEPVAKWSWTNKDLMRKEMWKVFEDQLGFQAFCPKSKASSFWPPGGSHPGRFFFITVVSR